MTLEQIAPPVTAQMARSQADEVEVLERGRMVYLQKCASCHSLEPVGDYTLGEWRTILPDMAQETKLNAAQTSDLARYIVAARRALDAQP